MHVQNSQKLCENRFLTPKETADRLQISVRSLQRRVALGKIPAIKIGGSVRFDWQKVVERLQAQGARR